MRELEIARTKIGEKKGRYKERYTIFSVYYGNYVSPLIDGEFVHLQENEYQALLKTFLESDAGKEYRTPTKEEMAKAEAAVVESEMIYLGKNTEDLIDLKVSLENPVPSAESAGEDPMPKKRRQLLSLVAMTAVIVETALAIFFLMY